MLADKDLQQLILSNVLTEADPQRVGPVSYDLRNYSFYSDGEERKSIVLGPGESVFVGSVEGISLPKDMTAEVRLKNSRIRQGLALAAPLYFPGHTTRVFFRVTNITADEIALETGHDIAQIMFYRLDRPADVEYSGTFDNEFDFIGLGTYRDVYGSETRKIKRESENLANMEQRIYGNVIAIMGVFIAIFSLANLDLSWLAAQVSVSNLIVLNLSIVGGMAALVGLIAALLGTRGHRAVPWILAAVSFATAIVLSLI